MVRVVAGVEYDGSAFSGWQIQKDGRSVQALVEQSLSRVADCPVKTICAGRTDAGVHAFEQVIHFDTDSIRTSRSWLLGANSHLPADVNLCWVRETDSEFHARFSALSRSYQYLILNRPLRSSLWRGRAWTIYQQLEPEAMRAACGHFMGQHDFTSLRASGCQAKSPVRTIKNLSIMTDGEWLRIDVNANAFLQHMVRNIVGILVKIGRGEVEPAWAAKIIAARDRTQAGITAPPGGLYLSAVEYPEAFQLPVGCAGFGPVSALASAR